MCYTFLFRNFISTISTLSYPDYIGEILNESQNVGQWLGNISFRRDHKNVYISR